MHMSMSSSNKPVTVKLQRVCRTVRLPDGSVTAPFMEALKSARRLPLPARTFYWLNKISAVLEREFADFEEARIEVVKRMGRKTATGFEIGPDQWPEFEQEMRSLDREIELPVPAGLRLALPSTGTGEDWYLLMAEMDVFEEPA
jgi:hypothetical protein